MKSKQNDTYNLALEQLHILDQNIRDYTDKIQENKDNSRMLIYFATKLARANNELVINASKDTLR